MYYPKSQIKTNLHTNGNEYILSTTKEEYKGSFYEVSNGNKYTGKSPSDTPNILILPINPDIDYPTISILSPFQKLTPQSITLVNDVPLYNDAPQIDTAINNFNLPIKDYSNYNPQTQNPLGRSLPSPNPTLPTEEDYKFGEFQRYFAKKNNELRYLEIDKQTYKYLRNKDPKIAWDLYSPLTVTWELAGNEEQVYKVNKNIVGLTEKRNKWYGFTQWFKDKFAKYYLAS